MIGGEVRHAVTVDPGDAGEIRQVVVDSVRHVLGACGIDVADPITPQEAPDPSEIVAQLGFAGGALRGTLTLIAPSELLRRSCPPIGNASEWEMFDWAGELANLVLGRVKVALAARGVDVESSTPRVMRVSQLQGLQATDPPVCNTCFSTKDGQMTVCVDAVGSNDHRLFTAESVVDNSLPEGEVFLFD